MGMDDTTMLAVSIAVPIVQGFGSALIFGGANSDWYKNLKKPSWTPPGWVFPLMWTSLYVMMGIASWLVWKQGGFVAQYSALGVYAFQMFLNFLWTPLFFGIHRIDWAMAEIVILWYAILCNIIIFWRIDPVAGQLLIPYIMWVSVATTLNWFIYLNNPPKIGPGANKEDSAKAQ